MKLYTATFIFDLTGERVLLVQKKHGPLHLIGKWNAIGGVKKIDEWTGDTAIREVQEETGMLIEDQELFCTLNLPNQEGGAKVYFYRCYQPNLECIQSENDAGESLALVNINHLDAFNLVPNLHWLMPLALDGNVMIAHVNER